MVTKQNSGSAEIVKEFSYKTGTICHKSTIQLEHLAITLQGISVAEWSDDIRPAFTDVGKTGQR